jgi:hypothetical protein
MWGKPIGRSIGIWILFGLGLLAMAAAKPIARMLNSEMVEQIKTPSTQITPRRNPSTETDSARIDSITAVNSANLKYIEGSRLLEAANAAGNPENGVDKARPFFMDARRIAQTANRTELNRVYSGWGDVVFDKFIPGLDLLLNAKNEDEVLRAADLLEQTQRWHQINASKMAKELP